MGMTNIMTLKEHVQAPHRRNPTAERDKNGFLIDDEKQIRAYSIPYGKLLHSYGKSHLQ